MNRRKKGFIILGIVYAFIIFVIIVNITNTPVYFFNPPEPDTYKHFTLFDPPYAGVVGIPNQTIIEVVVKADGSIIEGKSVLIEAAGSSMGRNTKAVYVVFDGAAPIEDTKTITIRSPIYSINGVMITPNNEDCPFKLRVVLGGDRYCGKANFVTWPNAGTFYPYLIFVTKDGKNHTERITNYPVTVQSLDREMAAQYNRVNIAFSLALLFFAGMEGVTIVMDLTEDKRRFK